MLRGWDWKSDGQGGADVLAELMVRAANGANYRGDPLPEPRQELKKWVEHLKAHAGRIDPPLGENGSVLRRGSVDLALPQGGTDVLRATSIWDKTEKGRQGPSKAR